MESFVNAVLVSAVRNFDVNQVNNLLQAQADVWVCDALGCNLLVIILLAAKKENLKEVREIITLLLAHGAKAYINRFKDGVYPLNCAAALGDAEVVLMLINAGALDYDYRCQNALRIAVNGNLEIVKILLDRINYQSDVIEPLLDISCTKEISDCLHEKFMVSIYENKRM